MAALNQKIDTLVAGDTWKIIRNFTGLPTGNTFTKVYLTIKAKETDADLAAIVQKSITASLTADGQITAQDSNAGTISFFFTLAAATTALLTPATNKRLFRRSSPAP